MRYPTAAFRRTLEDRLKSLAGNDTARLARYRKSVVFDRTLARLVTAAPTAWVLKGGFALDLRPADRAWTPGPRARNRIAYCFTTTTHRLSITPA